MLSKASPRTVEILHLEDSRLDHELVRYALRGASVDYVLQRVETLEALRAALQARRVDVVLADYRVNDFTAVDAWHTMQTCSRQPPFVILSGAIGEAAAVDAIRLGMADYVLKDNLHRLDYVLQRSLEVHTARRSELLASAERDASRQRLEDLTEHLHETIDEERASIAREIHDDIGGALAAVKLDLSWIARQPLDAATRTHLESALDMVQHALGASQRIMKNLRPAVLDQGVVAGVEWLLANFQRRTGIQTALQCDPVPADLLSGDVLQTVYRTTQEALTNVSKHAQARHVRVELSLAAGTLMLEVTDDGCGLGDGALQKIDSFGVRGLRERARKVGGWLELTSSAGGGTSVILSIPLQAAAPADAGEVIQ